MAFPAHNFVAHLSGRVRLKDRGTVRAFFAAELGKWVSGWKGRKSQKMKVLRTKFSIVGNVPTPDDNVFKLSLASQLPYNAKIQKHRILIISIFWVYMFCIFSTKGPHDFPIKGRPELSRLMLQG